MWTAADRLYKFMHTEQFKREILLDTDEINRLRIGNELKSRIEEKITIWHRENIEKIFMETFFDIHGERFQKIHEKLHVIKNNMQGIKTPFTDYPRIAAALASSICSSGTGLLGSLVVSNYLGSRYTYVAVGVAAAGIAYGLLFAGLVAFDVPDNFDTIRNRAFKRITNTLSKEEIRKRMRAIYENDIKTIIKTFMDGEIKEEIHNLKENIETMLNHLDDYRKEAAVLLSLQNDISDLMKTLSCVASMEI